MKSAVCVQGANIHSCEETDAFNFTLKFVKNRWTTVLFSKQLITFETK